MVERDVIEFSINYCRNFLHWLRTSCVLVP